MTSDAPMRLDPELAAIAVLLPQFNFADLDDARRLEAILLSQGRNPVPGISTSNLTVTGRDGTEIPVRIYRPAAPGVLPVILYFHGGAFILGGLDTEDDRCELYARDAECVVVSVDYRLSPENPYPAAFHDCLDVLSWLEREAPGLGIDRHRIAVGGNSAGGALAACVALESRAPDIPSITHQLLVNPVLDHRSQTASMRGFTAAPAWSLDLNVMMWSWYLGGAEPVDLRAVPVLARSLEGAPPTSLWIAEYDPLRDEAHEYAARLMAAGVSVGIYQYAGTIHGFDGYRMTRIGQRALADQVDVLRRAFRR